ncbi:MAG: hydroxyacid dehydrogenase [Phycisphaerales bacterium]|nr:hydroxyacid dehydrogenase [Phycisphaerales bacterium]
MHPPDADASAVPLSLVARILVVDEFGTAGLDALRAIGCDAIHNRALSASSLALAIRDLEPDILVVKSMRVSDEALASTDRLGLVVCCGQTTDSIDVAAASRRGVFVSHCPGRSAAAVAELAWGLIIACDRRLPESVALLRTGAWDPPQGTPPEGLAGRTLGIVGLGNVGQEIATRGIAFGMHVVAWSRHISEERCDALGIDYCANLVNLAKLSDVVSVSVSANEESEGLLGEKFFNAVRPGASIISTSPPSVINESALLNAVRTKGVKAGLDLHQVEPEARSRPTLVALLRESTVFATSQPGAHSRQAREAIDQDVVRTVRQWTEKGSAVGCINRTRATSAVTLLHVRHLNRPGVLAGVFEVLGSSGVNIEEMENVICAGGVAGIARIHVNATPTEGQITAIRAREHVLGVTVQAIQNESDGL